LAKKKKKRKKGKNEKPIKIPPCELTGGGETSEKPWSGVGKERRKRQRIHKR